VAVVFEDAWTVKATAQRASSKSPTAVSITSAMSSLANRSRQPPSTALWPRWTIRVIDGHGSGVCSSSGVR
jgi:hypothetical protein